MDHIQARLEALEQHTHTIERQLRWWRGLACGLIMLALLTWAPVGHGAGGGPPRRGQGTGPTPGRPGAQAAASEERG